METRTKWIDLSILGLFLVGVLGIILRSKIVFALPFINYNHLLEAHGSFTFGGWVTLALVTLMIYNLLPASLYKNQFYQRILGGLALCSWLLMVSHIAGGDWNLSIILSLLFILLSFIFTIRFVHDILIAKPRKAISLLAICAVCSLVLSSSGTIVIDYLSTTHSINAMLYRDALFTYLHFQYNGFFSLAIFALLLNGLPKDYYDRAVKKIHLFAIVLCLSIIPSLFLSYLWQDPRLLFRIIALSGSIFVLLVFYLFFNFAIPIRVLFYNQRPLIRFLLFLSICSFLLKTFLQSFTIFPVIGNAIFGNRPVIMGFLHLVFLGFVSLAILVIYVREGYLDQGKKITRAALSFFALSIIANEAILISQGLTTIFIPGSIVFQWLLWGIAICLFIGTGLIAFARIISKQKK